MKKPKTTLIEKSARKSQLINSRAKQYLNFREEKLVDKPNFEYTFTVDGVEVNLFDVNLTIVSPILTSDKIYADTGKPFYIEVRAVLNSPTGSGSLQLKDLSKSKDVFEKPQEFTFDSTGRGGLFLKDVKLP